jgi:hypothetical protein
MTEIDESTSVYREAYEKLRDMPDRTLEKVKNVVMVVARYPHLDLYDDFLDAVWGLGNPPAGVTRFEAPDGSEWDDMMIYADQEQVLYFDADYKYTIGSWDEYD